MNLFIVSIWEEKKRKDLSRVTGTMYEYEVHAENEAAAVEAVQKQIPGGQVRAVQPIITPVRLVRHWFTED